MFCPTQSTQILLRNIIHKGQKPKKVSLKKKEKAKKKKNNNNKKSKKQKKTKRGPDENSKRASG